MNDRFHMRITDLFRLQDGRTVLAGHVGDRATFGQKTGPCDVLVDGRKIATVKIHPELPLRTLAVRDPNELEAVGTYDETGLTSEIVGASECCLEEAVQLAELPSSV